jgi:hypothetical protein
VKPWLAAFEILAKSKLVRANKIRSFTMKNPIKPAVVLESLFLRQKLSGQTLLRAFKSLPRVTAIRLPRAFDDSNDLYPLLLGLTDSERTKFKITLPVKRPSSLAPAPAPPPPPPPPPPPQPLYQVRVHAILCANDDGSGGAADPNAVDAFYLKQLIDTTNIIYKAVGVQFIYNPATDFQKVNSSLLNLDFTIPTGLNFALPESQPPLSDQQVIDLAKPHADERQRVGREHRHKMVLLFCDGNMLVYDQGQKQWTMIFRTYAFSGEDAEFVALPTGKGDLQSFANLVAHETGHYFHQWHTHSWLPANEEDAAAIIRDAVEKGGLSAEDGAKVFDGDATQVTDTLPDPGNNLFDHVYGEGGCAAQAFINVPVTFSNGTKKEYKLKPDRGNVMSYFKHCLGFPMHFSPMQRTGIRRSLEEENRWHLIHPSMRLRALGAYVINNNPSYYAVWHPSEELEIQVYDWPYKEMRAKYDELWPQGWRLKILSPYVVNGQVRYAAVWKPSSEGEIQVYDWPYKEMRAKYDELWPQGWRLKILSPYVVNARCVTQQHGSQVLKGKFRSTTRRIRTVELCTIVCGSAHELYSPCGFKLGQAFSCRQGRAVLARKLGDLFWRRLLLQRE